VHQLLRQEEKIRNQQRVEESLFVSLRKRWLAFQPRRKTLSCVQLRPATDDLPTKQQHRGLRQIVRATQEQPANDFSSIDAGLSREFCLGEPTFPVEEERTDDGDVRISLSGVNASGQACRCESVVDVQLTNIDRLVRYERHGAIPVCENPHMLFVELAAHSRILRGQLSEESFGPVGAPIVD
jgi:hypothetical protein